MARLGVVHRKSGVGDVPACVSAGFVGPLQPNQFYCETGTTTPPPSPSPCMPTGSAGPLSPGQVWCDTGTPLPSADDAAPFINVNGTPAGQPASVSPWLIGGLVFAVGMMLFNRSGR